MSSFRRFPTFDMFVRYLGAAIGVGQGRDAVVARMLAAATANGRDATLLCEAFARDSLHWREPALRQMASRLATGVPLAAAVREVPAALPPEVRFAVKVGTETDTTPESLELAAYALGRESGTKSPGPAQTRIYIACVCFAMLWIVGFICYYIIPKFKKIFNDFAVELPRMTVAMINAADLFINYWYLIVLAGGAVLALLLKPYTRLWGRGRLTFLLPTSMQQSLATPDLMRFLAIAIDRDRSLPHYLGHLADQRVPGWMRNSLDSVQKRLLEGEPLPAALGRTGWLNHWEVTALEQSDRVGNSAWTLRELANTRELRSDFRWGIWNELARPAGMLLVSLIVGFFVVSMFLPLVKLVNDLS